MNGSIFSILAVAVFLATTVVLPRCLVADDIVRDDRPQSWQQDAELTDVFFLNTQLGWAVGAQGVILRTVDGGQTWKDTTNTTVHAVMDNRTLAEKLRGTKPPRQIQAEQLRYQCRFESVHFVDPLNGWVVGGYHLPFIDRSVAVIMKTNDGGVNWYPVSGCVIPAMNKVRFRDAFNGWALGRASDLYQTGVVYSADGGLTWSTQSAGKQRDWIDGESISGAMVMLDTAGQPALLGPQGSEHGVVIARSAVRLNDVVMATDQQGYAVGDRGALFRTTDGGVSWRSTSDWDAEGARQFDLHTIAVTPSKLWFAGKPATRIFCLDRSNGQVQSIPIPGGYRVNKIHFVDDQHGWIVCGFGRILGTADGGRSWQVQRGGPRRVSTMSVARARDSIGWQSLAQYASSQQFLSAVVCGTDSVLETEPLRQSLERLGVTLCTTTSRNFALDVLVREIRILRPTIVISDGSLEVETVIRQAILAAADRDSFPEQIEMGGLQTWQVDRLASRAANGSIVFDSGQMLAGSGQIVSDAIAVSRALVGSGHEPRESYRIENFVANASINPRELVGGLMSALPQRKEGSRRGNLEMIRQATQKSKQLDFLKQIRVANRQDLQHWRTQLQRTIGGLSSETAGVWIAELAKQYLESGNLELAARSLQYLTERWPDHPFSNPALDWLVRFNSSVEFAVLRDQASRSNIALVSGDDVKPITVPRRVHLDGAVQTVWLPNSEEILNHGQPSGTESDSTHARGLTRASQLLTRLRSRAPDMMVSSKAKWIEAKIGQQLQSELAVQRAIKELALDHDSSSVALAARRELAIANAMQGANRESQVDRRFESDVWNCVNLVRRPELDGKLGDQVWQQALAERQVHFFPVKSRLVGAAASSERADWVVLACDDQFLFFAAKLNKIRGQAYEFEKVKRQRDPDLKNRDRIQICLDTDRDYSMAFRLTVDHRGWAADECGGCRAWDPKWYVETQQSESAWTLEVAIPISQIKPDGIQPNTYWAIDIRRLDYDSKDVWQLPAERVAEVELDLLGHPQFSPQSYRLLRFQ